MLRCPGQYKCAKNFTNVFNSPDDKIAMLVQHIFEITAHFKGAHDGIGGTVKRTTDGKIERREITINDPHQWFLFLFEYFNERGDLATYQTFKEMWSKDRVLNYHVIYIHEKDIPKTTSHFASKLADGKPALTRSKNQFLSKPPSGSLSEGVSGESVSAPMAAKRDAGATYNKKHHGVQRSLSCSCSKCRQLLFDECLLAERFGDFIGHAAEMIVTETVPGTKLMDGLMEKSKSQLEELKIVEIAHILHKKGVFATKQKNHRALVNLLWETLHPPVPTPKAMAKAKRKSEAKAPKRPLWELGDELQARFQGKRSCWFDGKIAAVNEDGTFNVDYDDGDQEENVALKYIRKKKSMLFIKYTGKVGDVVEAMFRSMQKHWYKGEVTAINEKGGATVRYYDGIIETNISGDRIRDWVDVTVVEPVVSAPKERREERMAKRKKRT